MVRLIARAWRHWWLAATATDQQLMALLQIQQHHLLKLAAALHDREPAAYIATKHGRLLRLCYTLPAACRLWQS